MILNNLGIVHNQLNNFVKAGRCFKQAEKLLRVAGERSTLIQIACNLAVIEAKRGNAPRSIEELEKASRLLREHPGERLEFFVGISRGVSYHLLGHLSSAIEEFRKALEVDPEYYEALFGMATAYKKQEMFDEAIVGFKRLIEMDPKDTKSFLHLGDIYHEKGQLEEAKNYLKSGLAINPEMPVFHNNLGAVYLKLNMHAEAEQEFREALSIERSVPLLNAHFNIAVLHEARGEINQAIQEYKREQEISPFNFKPDFNLGLLYTKSKELDKAIEELESCIEKNGKHAEAYIFLAKAYMDSGRDLDEATRLAKNGLSLNPDLKSTILGHFVLADIYNRLGRHRESQQHVTQARELQKSLSNEE